MLENLFSLLLARVISDLNLNTLVLIAIALFNFKMERRIARLEWFVAASQGCKDLKQRKVAVSDGN